MEKGKKPVWNRSCNGDSRIRQVIGASAWPVLTETTKKASLSNKSSSESSKSLRDDGSSSSSSVPFSQKNKILVLTEQSLLKRTVASASTNGIIAQPSGQSSSGYSESPLPYPFHRGQNQRNELASQSHDLAQNEYQMNSLKNQNGNHYPHQSHGGTRNHEHGDPNWYLIKRNRSGRGGFAQPPRGTPGFIPQPPPPMPLFYYMPLHQPFYPFTDPMVFPEWAPSLMCQPHHIPFVFPVQDSSLKNNQFQDSSLETIIQNQVHYYFSEENLRRDQFLRKRMNDEGFVHIQFIAGFKKLKALTDNIQFILNALQGSDVVELKGYEIRNRYNWREFVMRPELRTPFYPSPEYEMASKVQNMSLEPKPDGNGSSSSNQISDNGNSSSSSTLH